MQLKLSFFPPSLPDETLLSRVSRYHNLSGNTSEAITLRELFDQTQPHSLDLLVPFCLETLAARLPGEPVGNMQRLVEENTLFPLLSPFLAKKNGAKQPSALAPWAQGDISHIPRHVVGKNGDGNLCFSCIREDEKDYGVAYWHRAHQIPGVTVCWKHKERLISNCLECEHPFQRTRKLLTVPWSACRCGASLAETTGRKPRIAHEHRLALFAYEMLMANIAPIPPDHITAAYRETIRKRGYCRGSKISMGDFQTAMINELSEEFVGMVDPAYSANRVQFWLRLHIQVSALDMPITRHLLLGMYLFSTAEKFKSAICAVNVQNDSLKIEASKVKEEANDLRDEHRKRVLDELKKSPGISLAKLWKQNYRTIAWLSDNDNQWLKTIMKSSKMANDPRALSKADELARKDAEFAVLIEQRATSIFEQSGKPTRVTIGKMLECLPKNISNITNARELYPISYARLDQCKESSWCFSARRILWALSELKRLGETPNESGIVKTSVVGLRGVQAIIEFGAWDIEALSGEKIRIPEELAKAGIGRTWRGPSNAPLGEIAGRGYTRTRAYSWPKE